MGKIKRGRELFEVLRTLGASREEEERPARTDEPPQKSEPAERAEELAPLTGTSGRQAAPRVLNFSLSYSMIVFAGIVGVVLLAVAYAVGRWTTSAGQPPRPAPVAPAERQREIGAPRITPSPLPSPATEPSAPGANFTVLLGTYGKGYSLMENLIKSLRDSGHDPFVLPDRTNPDLVQLCAGRFATREEAEQRRAFFASNKVGEWGPWNAPAVREIRQAP